MSLQFIGLKEISGPLVVLDNVKSAHFEEMVELRLENGTKRLGRVAQIDGERVVIQVFEGTNGLSLTNTVTRFTGKPMELSLSRELLGRVLDGTGRPIDGLGDIYPVKTGDINGKPLNPVSRTYPRDYIHTGISSIDGLATLIKGQKLPIFSGSGMSHNKLAVQIARQSAAMHEGDGKFGIVFGAMGVKNDVADYFRRAFETSGVMKNVVMLLNLSSDPIVERILTPKTALTAAEFLAYDCGMDILVILTDMTSYAEALREFSSSKGELPGRKGYPGYLYSDLASIYERAGIIRGKEGSVTQIPILTMPNDDITHPVPDLTGYITEGQISLDRSLDQSGVYPPVAILPSLSRLMKDGIGAEFTREDHPDVANQLFASYAKVQEIRALASIIGEDDLSEVDKAYLGFGRAFEAKFLTQGFEENRSIVETLDLGWSLLAILPKEELNRIGSEILAKYFKENTNEEQPK